MANLNSGKSNKEVVLSLIADLKSFIDLIRKESQTMLVEANALGESWNDPQYQQFISFIEELCGLLNEEVITFEEAKNHLEGKVNLM